jgi:hypothetical protein
VSPSTVATPAGVRIGPTAAGSHYLARNDHQHFAAPGRNRWGATCLPPDQYALFESAEQGDWSDSRSHLWAVAPGLAVIGLEGQRVSKFPARANSTDDWHGYPVSALDPKREFEHRPEPKLVSRWFEAGLIDARQRALINRGKV